MGRGLAGIAGVAGIAGALAAGVVVTAGQGAPPAGNAPGVIVTIDRNVGSAATPAFTFAHVAAPAKDDAAAQATVRLVDGEGDPNGAGVHALVDGLLPHEEDEPGSNFFFNAGTTGGRVRLDLGEAIDVAEVRTYSWHPNTRGPQVYTLYASDGTDPAFQTSPPNGVDPVSVGWRRMADVDTRTPGGDPGGQYGVSIHRTGGPLGHFRHLLFVCSATEMDDDWGNTFYSEIDVVRAGGGV